jgi:glycerophosphoryl diester phosphodiesterase
MRCVVHVTAEGTMWSSRASLRVASLRRVGSPCTLGARSGAALSLPDCGSDEILCAMRILLRPALVLLLALLPFCMSGSFVGGSTSEPPRPTFISHAGGTLGHGKTMSNSREALDLHYSKGQRYFEIDFSWTSDDHLVAIHDWKVNYERYFPAEDITPGSAPSREGFLQLEMMGGYTQLSLPMLESWLRTHSDARIVTDIKARNLDGLRYISKNVASKSQYVPQIYRRNEFEPARELGFEDIIFTLYRSPAKDQEVRDFSDETPLFALTVPHQRIEKNGFAALLAAGDGTVYAHTINDCDVVRKLQALGVHGVYTDRLTDDLCPREAQ